MSGISLKMDHCPEQRRAVEQLLASGGDEAVGFRKVRILNNFTQTAEFEAIMQKKSSEMCEMVYKS
jgi:hypothetical protein